MLHLFVSTFRHGALISSYISKCCLLAANEMRSQPWFYILLLRYIIQVCGMLHQSGSTFRHGALFLILHFQMVSTRCKRNGKSTVVLHFAFQTYHPGLRNVAPIWIHISTWCTFFILHLQMVAPTCRLWSHGIFGFPLRTHCFLKV